MSHPERIDNVAEIARRLGAHVRANDPLDGEMLVACATNRSYVMPLGVTLHSMLRNARPGSLFHIVVICTGIDPAALCRLTRSAQVPGRSARLTILEADGPWFDSLPAHAHITPETYFRLLLPEIVSPAYEKILYLDSDLCVLDDIAALWQTPMHGHALMAAVDPIVREVSNPGLGLDNYRDLGLADGHPYFNAGVLLMHAERWRQGEIGQKVVEYAICHADIIHFDDQESLNGVLARQWGMLDCKWNVNLHYTRLYPAWPDSPYKREIARRYGELMARPSIGHFAGRTKPWWPNHWPLHTGLWIKHLLLSRWFTPAEAAPWLARWLWNKRGIARSRIATALKQPLRFGTGQKQSGHPSLS